MSTFKALLLTRGDATRSRWTEPTFDEDGLALTGSSPVVRRWPMIPGTDLAGTPAVQHHLVPKPAAFTAAQTMAIGTAGYAAMLCVLALEDHGVTPGALRAGRPMGKERWAGAIDSVGSHTLANVLAQTRYGRVVLTV